MEFQGRREMEKEERIDSFIESMEEADPPFLQLLEKEASKERVPIIRPRTKGLLRFMIEMASPMEILEVGTAVGYSALVMDYYAPEGCHITTIEKMEERIEKARENFEKYGASERITLLEGDAGDILPSLTGPFDLIFMDAAKGQYIRFLPEVIRLLRPGGVLLSDNVLKEGEILESKFAVTRRNRTIHKRMREYLTAVSEDPHLRTVLLETGDGAALSVRRQNTE